MSTSNTTGMPTNIIPQIRSIDAKRRLANLLNIICYLLIIGSMFGGVIMIYKNKTLALFLGGVFVVSIIVNIIVAKRVKKLDVKRKVVIGNITKSVMGERIEVEDYDATSFIHRDTVKSSGLVPKYDRISGSDYMVGKYKGRKIVYSDIKLEWEKREENNRRRWVTIFQGPFVKIRIRKDLNGYVTLKERKSPYKKGFLAGVVGDILGLTGNGTGVEVENEAFNRMFKIDTNNQELAFYILTPQFMESIVELDELARGFTNICFEDGAVYIAINNGQDAFEVNKSIRNEKHMEIACENMRRDLDVILAIVDQILEKDNLFD